MGGVPSLGCGRPDVTKARHRTKLAGEGGRVLRLSGPWAAVMTRTVGPRMIKQGMKQLRKARKVGLDTKNRSQEWEWEEPRRDCPKVGA